MIYVEGGSKRQREIVKDAAMFAWKYLMPRISNCVVDVEIKKVDKADGYCHEADYRVFQIEIDKKLMGDNLLTTVFHEMVHVKQGVRKEWAFNEVAYKTHNEYINLPWEVEAYHLQEVMLEEWKKNLSFRR